MRKLIVALVGVAVCGLVVVAQAGGDAAKGKTIYADRRCGVCHKTTKDDANGGKLSTVLADTVGKLSVADLKGWLTDAAKMETKLPKKPPMPMSVFLKGLKPALSEAEVANLIAYVQTLPAKAPAPEQPAPPAQNPPPAAPAPVVATRPAPTPEQQAFTTASAVKDPTEKLTALAKVRSDFPASASRVDSAVLDTLVASFPDRKDDVLKAIDQVVADIPATAAADARLIQIQNLSSRLADKKIALDKIEPLLSGALGALTLEAFAKAQRAGGERGRGQVVSVGGDGARPATPLSDDEIATRFAQTRARALEVLGTIHRETGDAARAEAEYKEAFAALPSLLKAPVALAEIEAKRGNDKAALDYYLIADLSGHLKVSDEDAMRALYKKAHGSEAGLAADLDRVYREKFPNPVKVEEYKPAAARAMRRPPCMRTTSR
jgi:cytochrome c553